MKCKCNYCHKVKRKDNVYKYFIGGYISIEVICNLCYNKYFDVAYIEDHLDEVVPIGQTISIMFSHKYYDKDKLNTIFHLL